MSAQVIQNLAYISICITVSACVSVDQYSSRMSTQNHNASQAVNEETMLNILRASDYKPLSFLVITQMYGFQQQNYSIGLPTVTFGPGKELDGKKYVFGSNSFSSDIGSSFSSNPITTADFVKGQTAPIPTSNLAILLANYPREVVYYAAIDRIKVTNAGRSSEFVNDPSDNIAPENFECDAHESDMLDTEFYSLQNVSFCKFSKFRHLVGSLIDHGITAELIPVPQKPSKDDSDKSSASNPNLVGQFCYDPSLTKNGIKSINNKRLCGSGKQYTENAGLSFERGMHKVEVVFRSPTKMYRSIGAVAKLQEPIIVRYVGRDAISLNGERFLNIYRSNGSECDLEVVYSKEQWCLPSRGSRHTYALFSMLQNLRNLSISPDDLNKSLTISNLN